MNTFILKIMSVDYQANPRLPYSYNQSPLVLSIADF
jgi:hypothetical protein